MRTRHLLVALLLAVPATSVAAQAANAGRATFQMSIHIPDSLQSPIPISGDLSVQMEMLTDGKRIAVDILPGASSSMPMLAGMRVKVVFGIGGDTLHVGVVLPPELSAMAGGGSGIRMDMPLGMLTADNPLLGGMMDSIKKTMADSMKKIAPTYRKLKTTSTVAGLRCDEWETVVLGDTTRTCVIPTPAALTALMDRFKTMSGMGKLMEQIPGMADIQKKAYDGAQVTAIRTINAKSGLRMELTSFTPGAPPADAFELPAGLMAMPMPGGGGQR